MRATLLCLLSAIAAAGLVKAIPVQFNNARDNFTVGSPPEKNNYADRPKKPKVVGVAVKYNGSQRRILVTKQPSSSKGFELVRGKRKMYETSAEGAHREVYEEGGVYGEVHPKKFKLRHTDSDDKEHRLVAHIVKIPNDMGWQHNNERRVNKFVDYDEVEKELKRSEMLAIWNEVKDEI